MLKCGVPRWFVSLLGFAFLAAGSFAADPLPSSDGDDSFDIEPPLLIPYDRPKVALKEDPSAVAPPMDVEKLEKAVERARRSALNAEHLFRIGVLAKVEAEQRALKVVRLQADLENARLVLAKENVVQADNVAEVKAQSGTAATVSKPSDAELAKAIQAAHAAAKKREQAEIEAAEINLTRQQKLLSLGSGRKADVAKAARKLEELKAGRN